MNKIEYHLFRPAVFLYEEGCHQSRFPIHMVKKNVSTFEIVKLIET